MLFKPITKKKLRGVLDKNFYRNIMAQQAEGKDGIEAQYSLVVSTCNNNDLRVTCSRDAVIKGFTNWYTKLTNGEGKVKSKKNKYTNVILLDSARKDKFFGEYDWDSIIIDYALSKGFTLVSDGNSLKINEYQNGRHQTKLLFLSPKPQKGAKPPTYTMQ